MGTGKGPWPRLLGLGHGGNQGRLLGSSDATTLSVRINKSSREREKGRVCVHKIKQHESLVSGEGGLQKQQGSVSAWEGENRS